ncbi:MAG TPA: hypothetical protein VIM11_03035 [Tepidisphaeraceae bacterium]|jgi:hypothetical protein
MKDHEIENGLKRLGRETEPRTSMVDAVMRRVEQISTTESDANFSKSAGSRRIYRTAAMFIAVAACVAVSILVIRSISSPTPTKPIVIVPQTYPADPPENRVPRLIDYQRAYVQSPEALEALLQQRPVESGGREEPVVRAADISRSDLNLY